MIEYLIALNVPLIKIKRDKVKNDDGSFRRMPLEKWKDQHRVGRPASAFAGCAVAVETGSQLANGNYLYILDIDLKKESGRQTFTQIQEEHGAHEEIFSWGDTVKSLTESKGLHFWYQSPLQLKRHIDILPGIDFLGMNGFSFEPPSQFFEEELKRDAYEWLVPPTDLNLIAPLPEWLETLVKINEEKPNCEPRKNVTSKEFLWDESQANFFEMELAKYTPKEGLKRDEWLQIGMALHHGSQADERAYEIWHQWGERVALEKGGNYSEKDTRSSWDSFGKKEGVRIGTLIKILSENNPVDLKDFEKLSEGEKEKTEEQTKDNLDKIGAMEKELKELKKGLKEPKKKEIYDEPKLYEILLNIFSTKENRAEFKLNVCSGKKEVKLYNLPTQDNKKTHYIGAIEDHIDRRIISIIKNYAQRNKISQLVNREDIENKITAVAQMNQYNPLKDYINMCAEVYKKEKLILEFTDGFVGETYYRDMLFSKMAQTTQEGDSWVRLCISHWLQGVIAKILYGFQNRVLVFHGLKQATAKSTFGKMLCKDIGKDYYEESRLNPDDKDHMFKLTRLLVWEMAELAATTSQKTSRDNLKILLTKTAINERAAYARNASQRPITASFIGTVNEGKFLCDITGARRFLVMTWEPADRGGLYDWLTSPAFNPTLLLGEVFTEMQTQKIREPRLPEWAIERAEGIAENVRERGNLEDWFDETFAVTNCRDDFTSNSELRDSYHRQYTLIPHSFISGFENILVHRQNPVQRGFKRIKGILTRGYYGIKFYDGKAALKLVEPADTVTQ